MYYGGGAQTVVNNQSEPLTSDFVSLHLKGRTDGFAINQLMVDCIFSCDL